MLLKSRDRVSTRPMRPEVAVLLCCTSTQSEAEKAERLEVLLQENLNWAELLEMATQHRVLPLFWAGLKAARSSAIPQPILMQLRREFHNQTRHSLLLSGELVRLLNLFKAQGIDTLPFKGPVLAAAAYGNLSLRQFCDLDILVRSRDVEKAKALLLAEGYGMKIERIEVTPEQEAAFIQSSQIQHLVREAAYPFVHPQTGFVVELHWGIMPLYFCFSLNSEADWNNLETVAIAGESVPNLSPEMMLLAICGHGTKDCWTQLARICDVAAIVRNHPQLNWDKVLELARIKGGRRMLFLGLFLARDLLELPLPETILQQIEAEPEVKILAQQVSERLFDSVDRTEKDGSKTRFHLLARERWRDRVRYFLQLLFVPTTSDWLLWPQAEFPVFLYYLLRPLSLVRKQVFKPSKSS
ncbi:nucleotidyltransferase family protein [Oscillatoria sp. FACHB-1406]|uniref:nucleotidyltransferase domain-containing protein n=1 Tax=Oscillatoria sp. FACHB-1406 TaxID=2692846 RepID=UPI0016894237|nr:nucleotidyltransferase family protein [Oscillatoria sp. FACHB-1406]MBD2578885.1 nucleotidyltransferase family protein [Oscillatoria sp. FACHB-1406]